jgi:two-component system response regulator
MERPVEILFVDDSEAHARAFRDALAAPGVVEHHVRVAADGQAALDRLFHGAPRPDLVLLDLELPVVSGLDVLDAVKTSPDLRSIPVVVLARSPRPEDVAACYALGANSVVERPVRLDEQEEAFREIVRYWGTINILNREARGGGGGA